MTLYRPAWTVDQVCLEKNLWVKWGREEKARASELISFPKNQKYINYSLKFSQSAFHNIVIHANKACLMALIFSISWGSATLFPLQLPRPYSVAVYATWPFVHLPSFFLWYYFHFHSSLEWQFLVTITPFKIYTHIHCRP